MSTIALDFDGVLSDYTGWKGHSAPLDPPVDGAIQAIQDYQDAGFEVVIYTTRADSTKSIMRIFTWLMEHGLERHRAEQIKITNFKPPAIVYLDDRAICFTGKFPSVEDLKNFKTWKGM
jgi:histidinol phosphatase-like enzyme